MENDVKLLRNRVRMLQMEHEKAQKKIQETAKKTEELVNLRKRNDDRFMRVSLAVLILNTKLFSFTERETAKNSNFQGSSYRQACHIVINDDDIAFVYVCDSNKSRPKIVKSKSAMVAMSPLKARSSDAKTCKMLATTCMLASCKVHSRSRISLRKTRCASSNTITRTSIQKT